MTVTVRLFAALRDAAGTDRVDVEAASVAELVEILCERFGEPFAGRLQVASVLVDGTAVHRGATVPLAPGTEVALLPPVSGGA